jgi:hypothetical protein
MSKNKGIQNKPKTNIASVSAPARKKGNFLHLFLWSLISLFVAFIFIKQLKNDPKEKENGTVEFTLKAFFNGSYQESYEKFLLKKPFIAGLKKYKNKYDYLLLDKVNLDDAYVGKDNYIFGEKMTKAYFGDDYYGESVIKNQVAKAKYVQTKLKESGIELLILFAPGKSTIYNEFLPDYIKKTRKKTNNYETYAKECRLQDVNNIDFIQLFKIIKPLTRYPLFSRFGSHWSYFAECIVIDTTIKRLEKLMNVNLPNIQFGNIALMDSSMVRDGDIFRKIDMDIPKGNIMAYPQHIGYDQGAGVKPEKILAIGDSYFRGFFYLGAMQVAFDNSQQWYYYNSIIPENSNNPEVWELDLKQEILKNKAIVILCNEANLKNLGNGFIDDAYLLFRNEAEYYKIKKEKDQINVYKKEVRNNKELLYKLTKESQKKGITLDSLINETAIKLKQKN